MVPLNEAFIQSLDKYVLNVYRLPARLDPGDTAVNKANVRLTWAELSLWSKEDTSLITCHSAERFVLWTYVLLFSEDSEAVYENMLEKERHGNPL